jgi:hypothetical protein
MSMPEKVLGFSPHSDGSFFTILTEVNSVQWLQIRRHGAWIPVKPHPKALLVNVGDLLEVRIFKWNNLQFTHIIMHFQILFNNHKIWSNNLHCAWSKRLLIYFEVQSRLSRIVLSSGLILIVLQLRLTQYLRIFEHTFKQFKMEAGLYVWHWEEHFEN